MITMKNVRKTYGTFQMDLSMEIPSGQITGLVGKNGAGKSTAIKLILGLTEAESGEISVFGKNIHQLSMTEKAQIGAWVQHLSQYCRCAENFVKNVSGF